MKHSIFFYFLQDFLESCRGPTLLAELEDDDMPDEEEHENDENEDDDDYPDVMVSTNLLSFMVTPLAYLSSIIVRPRPTSLTCVYIG